VHGCRRLWLSFGLLGAPEAKPTRREMSNYVFGTSLRYQDYLQAKSFEDSLRGEISSASRSIIATNKELSRDHISVLESMSSAVTGGFDRLSFDMRALSDVVAELNSTFEWGFSEVLTMLGGLNDSLRELIKVAKTPAQTWAYEQFEIARDAFRQELYDDAIQYLNRAIGGHGDHTGYNLEYRFHYLLGTIRVGSFKNHSDQIVDPSQAEQAFLNAARYARHDHPKEAARSYLGAGWAAYCQGNMQDAERHTRDAMASDDSLGEAHFQLAKIQMHNGNPKAALIPLRTAITLDRGYTLKACTDGDFTRYQQKVDSLIETLRQEVMQTAQRSLDQIESDTVQLERSRAEQFSLAEDAPIVAVRKIMDTARHTASAETYYGYLDALHLCDSARSAVRSAFEALRQMHQQQLAELEALRRKRELLKEAPLPKGNLASNIGYSIVIFFVSLMVFGAVATLFLEQKVSSRALDAIAVVWVLLTILVCIAIVIGSNSERNAVVRERQAEITRIERLLDQTGEPKGQA